MINLGDEVKCKVTGFKGVVISIAKCLTGCDRAAVQPAVSKDGKHPDSLWFDVGALDIIKKGKVKPSSVRDADPEKKGGPPSRGRP